MTLDQTMEPILPGVSLKLYFWWRNIVKEKDVLNLQLGTEQLKIYKKSVHRKIQDGKVLKSKINYSGGPFNQEKFRTMS